jgi:GNAT superfamily N-acetyltransferase
MEKSLFLAKTKADLEKCFPVMKELRPHLSFDEYLEIYNEAHSSDGYEIVAIQSEGEIRAVMGYRILSDFVRGKHIYVDDLVSSEGVRSKGLGAQLLKYAESIAEGLGCKSLRLCTGIENERGVQFYEKNGWTKRAYAYTKKLKK